MQFHVKATRAADTSADHALGHPDKTGEVRYSRTYPTRERAQREAHAWACTGPYTRHGPSDWAAEVVEGPAPLPGKCVCKHAKRNHINGTGLCLVRSCRLCLFYRVAQPAAVTT